MTREEQIKEAARQRADQYDHPSKWSDTYYGFIDGANWADHHPQWIPVKEELPPPHYEGANSTDFVLVYDGYDVMFGYYDFGQKNWHGEDYKEMMFDVTHWMPLPEAPTKKGGQDA